MQAILCNSGADWRLRMQTSDHPIYLLIRYDLVLASIVYAAWVPVESRPCRWVGVTTCTRNVRWSIMPGKLPLRSAMCSCLCASSQWNYTSEKAPFS